MKRIMRNKKVIAMMLAGLVAILVTSGGATASPPTGSGDPPVESKISYQGQLTDDAGNPLDGTYDTEFRFYNAAVGGSQVGSTITKNDVAVGNGLFNVKLDVDQSDFNGQGLWLEVKVEGETLNPRQEILPVPYALSLKPGAEISGEETLGSVLTIMNTGSGLGCALAIMNKGRGYGIYSEVLNSDDLQSYGGYFKAGGSEGTGVRGHASGYGDVENYGGKFLAEGTYGTGVHAEATGTDGVGIYAKGGANGYAADLDGNVIIKGDVEYEGVLVGAFPSPAYDSGWVSISQGEVKTLTHNLGGNSDNYFVDLQFKEPPYIESYGVHQRYYGGNYYNGEANGAYWCNLTDTSIKVHRRYDDWPIEEIRVRIWVYN
jgi:hypothetical protein